MTRYLIPRAIAPARCLPEGAVPLLGGPLAFAACEIAERSGPGWGTRRVVPAESFDAAELETLRAPRPNFAGLSLRRPLVMGILNVTPDSFSDGGDRLDSSCAVADGLRMWGAGVDILDVGGESTRPGAQPISREEEIARVVPVIRSLADAGCCVSVDTRHAEVMRAAVAAGAAIVNDVSALSGDPDSLATVAELGVPVVLMHMQGTPETMQLNPRYDDAPLDVYDYLARRVAACEAAGIARKNICVDPGIGFGKTLSHNLAILDALGLYHGLGCPVMLGISRKSMVAKLSRGEAPKARVAGSLAAAIGAVGQGVQILRVHDVDETLQALALWRASNLLESPSSEA